MKKRLTELDSDPKYKNLVGKRVAFRGGDKNKVWVGKVDFIGTNPTHGKLQITINRTPVWPVDIKSLKVIPKFNNPGQEMGWFLDNNYVTHRGGDGMEYKLENTMNLKEWTENYIKSINENNLEEKLNSLLEKNVPNNPSKWSYYKSQAKKKFDVYPSAYANAWAAKKYKAAGGTWKKESVNEDLPTKEIDPKQFPNPLTNTKGFLKKGNYDGDTADDLVPTKPVSISVSNLKPSQDAIYLGKALGMAIAGVEGGDLGAVISKDNYILDGHHRYAATTFNNPSTKVGGVQADLMIGDLVPVLRAVGDAMKNKRGLEPKGGDVNIFKATMDDVKAAVYDGKNMDSKFYNKEKSIAWFEKIGEKTIAQRLKMLQSKRPPSGAPARKDMPKIHPNQLGILKTLLNKGNIDVRDPYTESVNEAIKKGDFVKNLSGELGLVNKVSGRTAYVKFPSTGSKSFDTVFVQYLKPSSEKHKGRPVYIEESVNEATEPEIITQLKDIVSKKQNQKLKDPKSGKKMTVDLYSASAVTQVYDALKQQSNKDKFVSQGLLGMVNLAFKLLKKESVNEAMDKSQLKKIYDNLQKGDEITIGYSSVMGGKSVGEFIVTKGKTKVGKARVERITLINKKNPRGVKYYLYQRNGFVTFAIGNLGAVINSITLKESVNEGNYKELVKLFPNFEKYNYPKVRKKGDRVRAIINHFTGKDGKRYKDNPYSIDDINKALSIYMKESVNESNDYFNTASQAVDYARKMIEKRGFEIDEDDWNTGIVQGGKYNRLRPGVGKTHSYSIGLLKNGKPQRKELQISLYGMPSGNYELTYYVN
jgi:hypothetical protein